MITLTSLAVAEAPDTNQPTTDTNEYQRMQTDPLHMRTDTNGLQQIPADTNC